MSKSLIAFTFIVLVTVIIFLAFQVNENSTRCRDMKLADQDRFAQAAKLLVQSTSQQNEFLSTEAIIQSKYMIDDLLFRYGNSTHSAERALKIPSGKLQSLRSKIYSNYSTVAKRNPDMQLVTEITDELIESSEIPQAVSQSRRRRRREKRESDE